jgi:protein TonB
MTLPRTFSLEYDDSPLRERVSVVVLVLLLHAGVGLVWMMQPEPPDVVLSEMSVSIAMQQAAVAQPQARPEPPPPRPQPRIERAEEAIPKPAEQAVAETAPQPLPVVAPPAVATAPVVDIEPDYKASYLNNPRPPYPMVARRMGYQGKVILNVEVLAEGACGAINVFRSSGHDVLDNAAMNTVKSWRFIPARRAGQAITKWFRVPVNFSLEDNEA